VRETAWCFADHRALHNEPETTTTTAVIDSKGRRQGREAAGQAEATVKRLQRPTALRFDAKEKTAPRSSTPGSDGRHRGRVAAIVAAKGKTPRQGQRLDRGPPLEGGQADRIGLALLDVPGLRPHQRPTGSSDPPGGALGDSP